MSKLSSTYRVFDILNSLNEGKELSILNLSITYNVNERTIYRDIELINSIFGNIILKNNNKFKIVNRNVFDNILKGKDLATFKILLSLLKNTGISINIDNNIKNLIKKTNKIYNFNTRIFENIKNKEIFNTIEKAIYYKQKLKIKYQGKKNNITILLNSYKIVMLNDNFYLLGMENDKSYILKISMIENLILKKETFKMNYDYLTFTENIQTPFAIYNNKKIKVILKVDKNISKYFKLKEYLLSQKIEKIDKDENLFISYSISNYKEIFELLYKWLPNIEIIEPIELKKVIKNDLKRKLKSL